MMKVVTGNIWDYAESNWIVIPTNIGWTKTGDGVLGAGLAKEAYERFPALAGFYGQYCRTFLEECRIAEYQPGKLLLFPTKALNLEQPWLSWKNKSTIELISKYLGQLQAWLERTCCTVAVPLLGCGYGGLTRADVEPVMHRYLNTSATLVINAKN